MARRFPALFERRKKDTAHRVTAKRVKSRGVRRVGTCCAVVGAVLLGCGQPPEGDGAPVDATILVDSSKRLNPISEMLYGHFAEFMFENIKQGLWAELLVNPGFENTAPPPAAAHYWERYPDTRNHANGFLIGAEAIRVSEQGYPPAIKNRAQVLANLLPSQSGHGIYQSGIPVRAGVTYVGSIWLRATGASRPPAGPKTAGNFEGRLRVTLEEDRSGGEVYANAELEGITSDWTKFDFELPAQVSDPRARFVLTVVGTGAIWIDQVSLMPGDAEAGLRPDVMAKIRALRPAFMRWPGGNVAQDYHWQWGIGPRDERPLWVNMSWDDDPEPADFGTLEYLEFCRRVGAEPNIVVNVEGRGATVVEALALGAAGKDIRTASRPATAEEAAAWVEYVNGPADSPFGKLRARDGHPEPFGVKYWEIGNEIWGGWVRGHSDAATYASNARRYIRAMKEVDPEIRFIAVGDEDLEWNRTVLEAVGSEIDMLAIHHYRPKPDDPPGFGALMARPLWYERLYGQIRDQVRQIVPDREVGVALNEWNTTFGIPRQHTMESALYGARLMNVFERQGELIRMSAVSDLVNGWPGGIIQASKHDVFTTATYSVVEAYSRNRGDWRVFTDVLCDLSHDTGDAALGETVPALDVVASTSAGGSVLFVKAVNTSTEHGIRAELQLTEPDIRFDGSATVTTITAPSLEVANTFGDPNRISARESELATSDQSIVLELPKHSVTVIQVGISR